MNGMRAHWIKSPRVKSAKLKRQERRPDDRADRHEGLDAEGGGGTIVVRWIVTLAAVGFVLAVCAVDLLLGRHDDDVADCGLPVTVDDERLREAA